MVLSCLVSRGLLGLWDVSRSPLGSDGTGPAAGAVVRGGPGALGPEPAAGPGPCSVTGEPERGRAGLGGL